jgi:hypothetical protein
MDTETNKRRHINVPPPSNSGSDLLSHIKNPLIVLLLIYIFFNPIIFGKMILLIPSVFASESTIMRHLRVIILGLLVAICYYGITRFV